MKILEEIKKKPRYLEQVSKDLNYAYNYACFELSGLKKNGFVIEEEDIHDKRKKILSLTKEGKLFLAKLDAMGMRGETSFKENDLDLGAHQKLSVSISSKNGSPVSLHQPFKTSEIDFKMYFRSGNSNWFGVDNQSNHGVLHMHFVSGAQMWDDRIELPESVAVSQLISNVFVKAEYIVKWKFPDFRIGCGSGFVGCA